MRLSRGVRSAAMRLATVVALSVALPTVFPARAEAHAATNTPASNYVSRVLAVPARSIVSSSGAGRIASSTGASGSTSAT